MIGCEAKKCIHNDDGWCGIHEDFIELDSEGMCEDICIHDEV